MKLLGLCLVLLLGPPGWSAHRVQETDSSARISLQLPADLAPAPVGIEMQLPSAQEIEAKHERSAVSVLLSVGLTGFLILLSLYFYRISVELGRETMRRERLARCFVQRNPKIESPPPVQGFDVDEIDSLVLRDNILETS